MRRVIESDAETFKQKLLNAAMRAQVAVPAGVPIIGERPKPERPVERPRLPPKMQWVAHDGQRARERRLKQQIRQAAKGIKRLQREIAQQESAA